MCGGVGVGGRGLEEILVRHFSFVLLIIRSFSPFSNEENEGLIEDQLFMCVCTRECLWCVRVRACVRACVCGVCVCVCVCVYAHV